MRKMITKEKMAIDPIPFDKQLLDHALNLKKSGLPWSPHTGCFVWEPHGLISAPSPFPHRVYFILNMSRFLHVFGDVEQMQDKLVWLPTWYQAMHLCMQMGVPRSTTDPKHSVRDFLSPKDELVRLYNAIEKKIKSVFVNTGDAPRSQASDEGRWILRVMDTELGSLTQLPDAVKRRVESMYREVATAYLGWRRIQENQASEWLPPENMFEPSMLRELGHFYSDYQHTIKTLEMTRRTLNLLGSVDPLKDPETHGQLMKVLLEEKAGKNQLPHRILEQLTRVERNPSASYDQDP